MSVRAITPQVPALGGGLQFWRDLDGVDLEMDSRWDEVDPSGFYPDPRLEGLRRGHGRPASAPPSPSVGAVSCAGESSVPSGDGSLGSTLGKPGGAPPSPIAAGHRDPLEDVRRPGRHPSAS